MPLISQLLDTPAVGVLDAFKANLWLAGGVDRAMLGGYPWSLYVTNSSGGSGTEIGFRDGAVNQGQLIAHQSNGFAFLTNHDASRNGLFFAGNTAANVPAISSGGSYLGWLQFDGTNDCLASSGLGSGFFGGIPAITVFMRAKLRNTSAAQILMEHSTNFNSNNSFIFYYDNAISRMVVSSHMVTGGRYAVSEFNVSPTTEAVFCFRVDRAQTTGAAQCVLFFNGTKQTRTGSTAETSPVPSGNFDSTQIHLGARNYGASVPSALNLKNLAIYTTALSDADCTAISALL